MTPRTRAAIHHLLGTLLRVAGKVVGLASGRLPPEEMALADALLTEVVRRWTSHIGQGVDPLDAPTPLTWLREGVGLSEHAIQALLVVVAPDVDSDFGALWRLLLGEERPDVARALDLLEPDPLVRLERRAELDATSPLRTLALIEADARGAWRVAPRLTRFLCGASEVDPELAPRVQDLRAPRPWRTHEPTLDANVAWLGQQVALAGAELLVLVKGPEGTGRRRIAEALCLTCDRPVLQVDLWGRESGAAMGASFLPTLLREVALLQPLLILDAAGPESSLAAVKPVLGAILTRAPVPAIVLSRDLKLSDLASSGRKMSLLEVPRPSLAAQQRLWEEQISVWGPAEEGAPLSPILAERFDLTAPQIAAAARVARSLVDSRSPGAPMRFADLQRGSLELITHSLGDLAWRLPPSQLTWDDLITAPEARRQLTLMVSYVAHRRTVYDRWGVGRFLSGGRGIKALFYGPPGTGKTMAASLVARDLGLDVYQVDLSQIVSKWVGETEKNLDRLLTVAEDSNVVLLFDEADALFGERGDVKSATDRYANLEVNFLLQRFDAYDGVVILTSNLVKSVDKAFSRRLHFLVEFPFPEEPERLQIWQRMLSSGVPVGKSVDPVLLARRFELAGGNIRNSVMTAAFLAAEAGSQLEQIHLFQALLWEMQKQGMAPSRSAFGDLWSKLM